MAKFFDPQSSGGVDDDLRLHAPATARNRDALAGVLQKYLPKKGTFLEVASGTGEHAAYIAPTLIPLKWQPTDIDMDHLKSIDAWRESEQAHNVMPAQYLDITVPFDQFTWMPSDVSAVAAVNLIHIAPWSVAEALVQKAGTLLNAGGLLFLYGPYKKNGEHTSQSNESFNQSLKSRNPSWGVRDMEVVTELAKSNGFTEHAEIAMPANNFSLIFKKS